MGGPSAERGREKKKFLSLFDEKNLWIKCFLHKRGGKGGDGGEGGERTWFAQV